MSVALDYRACAPSSGPAIPARLALRRALRRRAWLAPAGELNPAALLHMAALLMAIVLQQLHALPVAQLESSDLALPTSALTSPPWHKGPALFVTKTEIFLLDGDITPIAELPAHDRLATEGLAVRYGSDAANGFYLPHLGSAVRFLDDQHGLLRCTKCIPGDFDRVQLLVIVDKDTPYRLFYEVFSTLAQENAKLRLVVRRG